MIEEAKLTEANALSIIYSNTNNPGFEIIYYNAQKAVLGTTKVKLEQNQITGGLPLHSIDLGVLLKSYIPPQIKSIKVLLDSDEIFKATNAYPKVNMFKLANLYAQDLKTMLQDGKEKYKIETQKYKDNLGSIFYTYFIPQNLFNFAIKLARSLNVRLENTELLATRILQSVKKGIHEDFIYLYEHEDQITIVVSYGQILTGYTTIINDLEGIDGAIYQYGIKHFYELEKIKLDKVYTNKKELFSKIIHVEQLEIQLEQ